MGKKAQRFFNEVKPVGREAVKDLRSTIHEAFFGKAEGPGEPGTPYNPTVQTVHDELGGKQQEAGGQQKSDKSKDREADIG